MTNEKRSFIAVFVCILFYLAYSYYLQTKYPNHGKSKSVEQVVETSKSTAVTPAPTTNNITQAAPTATTETAPPSVEQIVQLSPDQLKIENSDVVYEFNQTQSSLKSITLKNYSAEAKDRSKKEQIVDSQLLIQAIIGVDQKAGLSGYNAIREGNKIVFSKQEGPWKVSQTFEFPEKGYGADITFSWTNTSASPIELNAAILMQENMKKLEKTGSFLPGAPSSRPMAIGISGEKDIKRQDIHGYCKKLAEGEKELAAQIENSTLKVLGLDSHYFVKAILPNAEKMGYSIGYSGSASEALCPIALVAWQPQGFVNSNQTITIKTKAWFGPKDVSLMDQYAPTLSKTIDFGFFGVLASPLLSAVRFAHKYTGNWGIAIIIITILMKILFFPLNNAAAVSAHKMKKLAPKLKELQDRYKDDRVALQQAMLKFYAEHKVNPMKGCLPILPQLPVFFAFFQMLATAIELRHAPFFGWLSDLSAPDQYYITPILLGAAYFIQQKMTPAPGMDKTQQQIMLFLPVVFSLFMITFPSGLVIYSLVNTIFTIAQQTYITRRLEKTMG